ncbi:hypothetical protein RFI_23893, partial [Reticulomyxa filosa]
VTGKGLNDCLYHIQRSCLKIVEHFLIECLQLRRSWWTNVHEINVLSLSTKKLIVGDRSWKPDIRGESVFTLINGRELVSQTSILKLTGFKKLKTHVLPGKRVIISVIPALMEYREDRSKKSRNVGVMIHWSFYLIGVSRLTVETDKYWTSDIKSIPVIILSIIISVVHSRSIYTNDEKEIERQLEEEIYPWCYEIDTVNVFMICSEIDAIRQALERVQNQYKNEIVVVLSDCKFVVNTIYNKCNSDTYNFTIAKIDK